MGSKYKVAPLQAAMLGCALLLILLALSAPTLPGGMLLVLAGLWLTGSSLTLKRSVRWPSRVPWQLLPSFFLAGLFTVDPQHQTAWLWCFALLLMLPQPIWLMILHGLLAGYATWQLQTDLDVGQTLLVTMLLVGLMLLGLARAREVQSAWLRVGRRRRLIPGAPLWSAHQLGDDLTREVVRSEREGSYAELVLLRTQSRQFWPLMDRLSLHINDYEACYKLDNRTLATLLISSDLEQARERRNLLLDGMPTPLRCRFITLARPLTLASEYQALRDQRQPLVIIEEE
ncbi:hypothetical protein SAMN05216571_11235 [Onishia taeanensis]|jgi:hypothetical protein|uniref:Uncharacterized protein n=1 Tax=Onishia taeanensis TaxID=284577 RepID=A0A1G7TZF2_9GAMM|nr:hypothetical protein [Halomonas taeanensis]MAX31945.1 hypothetical protein [Halomonadaceae bacterium]SDG40169.1 hypothetical protein SAMN05216571_11235 [Halomonas taeanensis]